MLKLKYFIFLLLIFPSFLKAQDCQLVVPIIETISPPPDAEGYIDICLGDPILLNGTVNFPQNNTSYEQSVATSLFRWISQDGQVVYGVSSSFTPVNKGGHELYYQVIDSQGCDSTILVAKLRVSGPQEMEYATDLTQDLQCASNTIQTLEALPQSPITEHFSDNYGNIDQVALPDGGGASIYAPLNIYEPLIDTLTAEITSNMTICVNIEHSYMRDIEVNLICPNGTIINLAEQLTSGGEVFLGEPFEDDEIGGPVPGIGYQYCWTTDATNGTWIEYANANNPMTLPPQDYNSAGDLNDLIGCPFSGEWNLKVQDWWGIDNGFIFGWSIELDGGVIGTSDSFDINLSNSYWQNTGDNITDNTGNILSLIPQTSSEYIFTTEDDFGCVFDYSFQTDILSVDNVECVPCEEIMVDGGEDVTLTCSSDWATLNASEFLTGLTISYLWTTEDGGYISDTSIPNPLVDGPGHYVLTMMRSDGCQVSDIVTVYPAPEVNAEIGLSEIDITCFDGSYTIDASASSSGDNIIYQWALEGVNLEGANSPQIEVAIGGNYELTVTDIMAQCSATASIQINIFEEIIEEIIVVPADCEQANGSIEIIPNGTTEFAWSTGETTSQITNLEQAWYSVTITTADCTTESNIFVDEMLDCKAVIGGRVYLSSDCSFDDNTETVECIMLHLMPNDVYTYTDADGYYEFVTDEGTGFTINYIEEDQHDLVCPSNGSIIVPFANTGSVSNENHFFVEDESVTNLCVDVYALAARPGFSQYIHIGVCNYGDEPASGSLIFTHDSLLLPGAALLNNADSYDADTYTATFNFETLLPEECIDEYFYLEVPVSAPLDSLIYHEATVTGTLVDDYPENNSLLVTTVITGSFDPNDKQNQTGTNPFGSDILLEDDLMRYQIRFQNTGTDTAFTVVVEDILDESLDVTSIRPGLSSHDYAVEFEGNNKLIFRFDNIMLPDSFVNESASNGYVNFTIRTHENLPIGTVIENEAAIFLDYNEPVITNTVVNTIVQPTVAIEELITEEFELFIQPNPVHSELNYAFTLKESTPITVELHSSTGKFLQTLISNENMLAGKHQLSSTVIDRFSAGTYFLFLRTNKGVSVKKWVKL